MVSSLTVGGGPRPADEARITHSEASDDLVEDEEELPFLRTRRNSRSCGHRGPPEDRRPTWSLAGDPGEAGATETDQGAGEEDEEVVPVELVRDERAEPFVKVIVPMQETEFMCKNCYLVKHRSQLADKKKMLCRDCA